MSMEILMPALSPTMSEGKLIKWFVKAGDKIKAGDLLAEIETDKAIMEFESPEEGILTKMLLPEGDASISVNQPIAILDNGFSSTSKSNSKIKAELSVAPLKAPKKEPNKEVKNSQIDPAIPEFRNKHSIKPERISDDRIKISPLARKMAEKLNVNISNMVGSGPSGRIVKADILELEHREKTTQLEKSLEITGQEKTVMASDIKSSERILLTPMRKTIADRLTSAKRDIPHFYLRKKARVDKLLDARKMINKNLLIKGIKVSLNDMIIKAVGQALQDNPNCNVTWGGDHIMKENFSDIAIAVAIKGGLLTPVVRNVARKTLSEISLETKDLIIRSKEKKLTTDEFSGGTITISNLGMMGIDSFDAIINPPHGSILAVSKAQMVPVFGEGDNIEKATIINLTLSVDHRAIGGAIGASFLGSIVSYLEEPITLLS
ncbi:MAG: dihydrolipoamide acetyltransferase family protein [Paracoccaceae bacterium]|nr:dihydrolipoamide acetyltransferase family protein [Paracoccaceae bacterium]